jgi:hypothetical protein
MLKSATLDANISLGCARVSSLGNRWSVLGVQASMSMRMVNGYVCRNCADEELAKKGFDPARPKQAFSVAPSDAARNRSYRASPEAATKTAELGVNRPDISGAQGRKVDLYA